MKTVLFSLMMVLLPLLSAAQQTINYTITVDSVTREFILYVPASYNSATPVPLILSYHGLGGNAQAQMNDHDFRPLADAHGFIVAHPEGAPIIGPGLQGWNFVNDTLPNDLHFTSAMIDTIAADYAINPDRIYACGMSFGGFFSIFLAGQMSDKIAAVASVAGTVLNAVPYSMIAPVRPISVLEIHGTADNNVAYTGSQASQPVQAVLDHFVAHNNCDPNPNITPLPNTNTTDGSTVEHIAYANGDEGTVVEHLKITGGGHTWPDENTNAQNVNRDINGCEEIWKFFSRFDMNGALEVPASTGLIEASTAITVFPNPANSHILLQVDGALRTVSVFNAVGQTFTLPFDAWSGQTKVDVSSLPAGLYFVSGQTDIGIFQSSFVKQ